MYAIVHAGGKQLRVAKGDRIRIEKVEGQPGDQVTMHDVLMVADGDKVKVGSPVVAGAQVVGTIVAQGRSPKVLHFRFRHRKNSKKIQGHRQPYTAIEISDIKA